MAKRKPLMPGDRVRCVREDGNPCPGHLVTSTAFYGPLKPYAVFVHVSPDRCGWTDGASHDEEAFVRLPMREVMS